MGRATVRSLMSLGWALAACAPSPQERAMQGRGQEPGTIVQMSNEVSGDSDPTRRNTADQERVAAASVPVPVSASEHPARLPPARLPADSPAAALGRRTLSTAFVMVGPDGRLTVERRDGRVLVLRDMVMRPKDYCGIQLAGGATGGRYCGGYDEVAAARPGGAAAWEEPTSDEPAPAMSDPVDDPGSPARRE